MREKADDLGSLGFDYYYGYGRINAREPLENTSAVQDMSVRNLTLRKNVVGQGMRLGADAVIKNLREAAKISRLCFTLMTQKSR